MLRSILQNSTAGFYILASDSTTPTSGKTGLTITTTLSKVGGTANSVSPTITEIGNGLYWVAPIAAHRDTLGEIAWQFSATGAIIAPRLEKVVLFNDQVARGGASAAGDAMTLAASQPNYAPSKAGDAMALTTGERSAVAAAIEVEFMNDLSGGAFMQAISDKLSALLDQSTDLPVQTLRDVIVSGVWSAATRTLTAIPNVTVGGYASGQDPAAQLSTTVSKISTIDALLSALTEVVSAVTRFRASALTQAPGSAGGLTSEQQAQLNRIESSAAQINGARLETSGSVTPGGSIQLIVGKDYVTAAQNGLNRTVSDPGGILAAQLQSATQAAVKRFGAQRPSGGPQIVGTIGSVTYSNGVTTIPIEISRDAIPDTLKPGDDYRYMIERQTSDGKLVVCVSGDLSLERRTV